MLEKIIANLYSSKALGPDYTPVVALNNYKLDFS